MSAGFDYSKLSDEDLEKLAGGGGQTAPKSDGFDYSSMSDEQLEQLAGGQSQPATPPLKAGDPVPVGEVMGPALRMAYEASLPGKVHGAVRDYFTDVPVDPSKPVSKPRAVGLALQQVAGGDDGEVARDDYPQEVSFGGEGRSYLPQVPPPADGRARATIDAERKAEVDQASAQHPVIYRGTQAVTLLPDAAASLFGGMVRRGSRLLGRVAQGEGGRALGYTDAIVRSQGDDAAASAINRALDEGIVTRSNTPREMTAAVEPRREALGEALAQTRADLDSIKEGIHIRDLATRLSRLLEGPATRRNVKLDSELAAMIDDASKYADESGLINASSLARLKDDWGLIYRQLSEESVQAAEGVRGLTRDAHGVTLGAENEVFERAAPGALADKRRYADYANLEEPLTRARARDVLARPRDPRRTMTDRVVSALDAVYGGGQARAVDARRLQRIADSRFAPVLEAVAANGGGARLSATVQALLRNDEFRALLEGDEEPAAEVPPTPSDERVKTDVQGIDSKQVLRRYVQVQAGKRPAEARAPDRAVAGNAGASAGPTEKRREAYAMTHEGGKLRSIEGARKRITIVRDKEGLPISMELETL